MSGRADEAVRIVTKQRSEDVSQDDRTTGGGEHKADDVMELLAEHVPLALLVDLVTPQGPKSEEILEAEGKPEDAWWKPDDADSAAADDAPSARSDG
jgi:hypothetical protein